MPISDKLAHEIIFMVGVHLVTALVLMSFTAYVYLKAKKNSLLYTYLGVVAMILLWLSAKIFKTVAPNEALRWSFIVLQYVGVEFLGLTLILFAYRFVYGKLPSNRSIIAMAMLPSLAFLLVATNPFHMLFYSYYDFYKDRFGPLFYPTQILQYIYWIVGIVMLAKVFNQQSGFKGSDHVAKFFAAMTLFPLLCNGYYVLYKTTDVPWLFPFPVFDITPVASAIALIFFMIPVMTYRFFDLAPLSYGQLYVQMNQGLVLIDGESQFYCPNRFFNALHLGEVEQIKAHLQGNDLNHVLESPKGIHVTEDTLLTTQGKTYHLKVYPLEQGKRLLGVIDTSLLTALQEAVKAKNIALEEAYLKLDAMDYAARRLAMTQMKMTMAQNMHDILGHSLTVVISMLDLASQDVSQKKATQRIESVCELLSNSLVDLKNAFVEKSGIWRQSSLEQILAELKNDKIDVRLVIQGKSYDLDNSRSEAIYRLCQEGVTNAIKHGKATTIHIFLRYQAKGIQLFLVDDGVGCGQIHKNMGLEGIDKRIESLKGSVRFGSDGSKGFSITAFIPQQ